MKNTYIVEYGMAYGTVVDIHDKIGPL